MTEPFTPSTSLVRTAYAQMGPTVSRELLEEFDRWLAEAKAAVWYEGFANGISYQAGNNGVWRNPYTEGV